MQVLLAIDLGLGTGIATYGEHGRLLRYRGTRLPDRTRLKRAIPGIVRDLVGEGETVVAMVAEGDRRLARFWGREARRREAVLEVVAAGDWRPDLLLPRERRSGRKAKAAAGSLARSLLAEADIGGVHSLRHDAAEAICLGAWAAARRGWRATPHP